MQAFMTASQTRTWYAKWGVQVKYYKGWETRGRPASTGPHKDARGIMIHHTGSDLGQNSEDYNYFLFVKGRPAEGIPGPLCNEATEMDGDVIQGATGRCNHAGAGSRNTLDIVTAGKMPLSYEQKPGPDAINGNDFYYANEVKYDGGQPMTIPARRSVVLASAARCDFHGWNSGHVLGHKEHTGRKDDPRNEYMFKLRVDIGRTLQAGPHEAPGSPSAPPKDLQITIFCINRLQSGLGVDGECLIDNYQIMNIAVYFYDKMAETTRPAFWNAINIGDWKRAGELQTYALKIIQSNAKIEQTGKLDANTAKFLRASGYTVL